MRLARFNRTVGEPFPIGRELALGIAVALGEDRYRFLSAGGGDQPEPSFGYSRRIRRPKLDVLTIARPTGCLLIPAAGVDQLLRARAVGGLAIDIHLAASGGDEDDGSAIGRPERGAGRVIVG